MKTSRSTKYYIYSVSGNGIDTLWRESVYTTQEQALLAINSLPQEHNGYKLSYAVAEVIETINILSPVTKYQIEFLDEDDTWQIWVPNQTFNTAEQAKNYINEMRSVRNGYYTKYEFRIARVTKDIISLTEEE